MIKIPAYLQGFSSRADKSAGIRFATQELDGETFALLQSLNGVFGWLLFKENVFEEGDIPTENAEEEGITASERLRRRMFVYWKKEVKSKNPDFELWRKNQLELLGEKYLSKID